MDENKTDDLHAPKTTRPSQSAMVDLIHLQETHRASGRRLMNACALFEKNMSLLTAPYRVKSVVTADVFRDFISAIEERPMLITPANFHGLSLLCAEFGFEELSARLSAFRPSIPPDSGPPDLDFRVSALEEGAVEVRRQLGLLESENRGGASVQATLSGGLRGVTERLSQIESEIRRLCDFADSAARRLSAVEDSFVRLGAVESALHSQSAAVDAALLEVRGEIAGLRSEVSALIDRLPAGAAVAPPPAEANVPLPGGSPSAGSPPALTPDLDSVIIREPLSFLTLLSQGNQKKAKWVLIGDSGVGKSEFFWRLRADRFSGSIPQTVGLEYVDTGTC
jgi:hypothetical protein